MRLRCFGLASNLVNPSAGIVTVGMYNTMTQSFSTASQTKWYLMLICLTRLLARGFLERRELLDCWWGQRLEIWVECWLRLARNKARLLLACRCITPDILLWWLMTKQMIAFSIYRQWPNHPISQHILSTSDKSLHSCPNTHQCRHEQHHQHLLFW